MGRFDFQGAVELLSGARKVAICGHVNPDGDCIGSTLAIALALKAKGLDVTPLVASRELPSGYEFMEGYDMLVPAHLYKRKPDVMITVDVPSIERTGDGGSVFKRAEHCICFDHHQGDGKFADFAYVDEQAASASLVIWDFIKALGVETTPAIADCCYMALLTDTGRFQFQNTDERAFLVAAEMVAAGADPAGVALEVYQNVNLASLKLQSLVVERMEFFCENRAVYSWITNDDFTALGATAEDGEDLIDVIRQVKGVEIALMLRDQGPIVRGSLRSKSNRDVSRIAAKVGGGGHKAAAGFTVKDTLAAARKLMIAYVEEEFSHPAPAEGE